MNVIPATPPPATPPATPPPGYGVNCFAQTPAADQSEDYLLVPNAVLTGGDRVTHICGNIPNTVVVTCT